ncbi:hypothetical protein BMS_0764 [Halobacteriovorax marinus SJ]|uniref:Uncharacterized protein n=1 Tax=Halobacteriovorax marinus (strain ATCC BAA-682 / DSM 15412 / SJ) TaxID=862908 RepID=E1X5V1_HALMS|nr:hypothetical protein [Halobacteriovorax marinus]CBW25668.1 hypothetical protein BMS_0764 [Halobacteriovorax marinus SJ]
MSLPNLEKTFKEHWSLQEMIDVQGSEYLNNLSKKDFLMAVSMRNLRSRGVDIEKRVIKVNKWESVSGKKEQGDAKNQNRFIEIKSSIITPLKNSSITLRGMREWEDIDYYCFVIIDYRNFESGKINDYIFYISRKDLDIESKKYGLAKKYNLSEKASKGNKNIPLGINMKIGDKNFKRWEEKFSKHNYKL